GRIEGVTHVRDSVVLATGEFGRATVSENSFYQVSNQQLRFTRTRNNVYVKPAAGLDERRLDGVVLDTQRGPLQMLKFGEDKKDEAPWRESPRAGESKKEHVKDK